MIQTPILIPAEQYSKGEKCPLRATVMRAKYVIIIYALGSAHEKRGVRSQIHHSL